MRPADVQDLYLGSIGYSWPMANGSTFSGGGFYVSEGVEDEDRTLALRLDTIYGVGAGVTRDFRNGELDFNVNVYRFGDAGVDTGDGGRRGRVVGESDTPWAVAIDVAYHF